MGQWKQKVAGDNPVIFNQPDARTKTQPKTKT
jgi:hypothetical protein